MNNGFFRVAAGSTKVTVANPEANFANISDILKDAYKSHAEMLVLPEMGVTAYTCGDLFHSEVLLQSSLDVLKKIASLSSELSGMLIWVGAPVKTANGLYNCAIALCSGEILAVVPKQHLPNYNEFYEHRWWLPAPKEDGLQVELWEGCVVELNNRVIVETVSGVKVGAEICEDLWAPNPPSTNLALAGAEIIANLSASDDLIGKYSYLRDLVIGQSARTISGYVYASAGFGESSTDLVFDSKLFIAENGSMLNQNQRWQRSSQLILADIDIEAIRRDRMHIMTFSESSADVRRNFKIVKCQGQIPERDGKSLLRKISPTPFIPQGNPELLSERCEEIINIQVAALAKRMDATGCKNIVIGISGGLDSTLALLIACRTYDNMGWDKKGIHGVTMPGFGTTGRTHKNAVDLMTHLGVTLHEISIVPAVTLHFKDISHNDAIHDITYENSQARERTQILMDLANKFNGMVLGTGDLSELALGWATYNGDHMSMYGINSGIPKTLVRHLTTYFAENLVDTDVRSALLDVIDTPVSPELLPPTSDGKIAQETEDLVGPYELHDFFLYYTLRFGFTPKRILYLAENAFKEKYSREILLKWIKTFFRRFFAQQFKRSCLPDGPKIGSVCLSPRGDWRMPSDASPEVWLKDLE